MSVFLAYVLIYPIIAIAVISLLIAIIRKSKKAVIIVLAVSIPVILIFVEYMINPTFTSFVECDVLPTKTISIKSGSDTFHVYLPKRTSFVSNRGANKNIGSIKFNQLAKHYYSKMSYSECRDFFDKSFKEQKDKGTIKEYTYNDNTYLIKVADNVYYAIMFLRPGSSDNRCDFYVYCNSF